MSELDILRHENAQLRADLDAMTADRDHWKANHANVVALKRKADEYKEDFRSRAVVAERRIEELEANLAAAQRDLAHALQEKAKP